MEFIILLFKWIVWLKLLFIISWANTNEDLTEKIFLCFSLLAAVYVTGIIQRNEQSPKIYLLFFISFINLHPPLLQPFLLILILQLFFFIMLFLRRIWLYFYVGRFAIKMSFIKKVLNSGSYLSEACYLSCHRKGCQILLPHLDLAQLCCYLDSWDCNATC